jgi:hypothetical protein
MNAFLPLFYGGTERAVAYLIVDWERPDLDQPALGNAADAPVLIERD